MNELKRRFDLLQRLKIYPYNEIPPNALREHSIYGGAQGIYVDKKLTASLSGDGAGVTVSVLNIGDVYPDELSEDGLIYHYPRTERPVTRDKNEVSATKNSLKLGLPIFVIFIGRTQKFRQVKLGWVVDFDDKNEVFLIEFTEKKPVYEVIDIDDEFRLMGNESTKVVSSKVRPDQRRFRYEVIKHYGYKCFVCDINHPKVLDAAHIRGKEDRGSDDWRNGMMLCRTHHAAFDNGLFCINPVNLEISVVSHEIRNQINLVEKKLKSLTGKYPHPDALKWRWKNSKKLILNV